MSWSLPEKTQVNKIIPKNTFYHQGKISTSLRAEFVERIENILWTHTLSPETFLVPATSKVEEIQIITITLKTPLIPKRAISYIDSKIPYPILFELVYQEQKCYALSTKVIAQKELYISNWSDELTFSFKGHTLQVVYESLVKSFLTQEHITEKPLTEVVEEDTKRRKLQRQITSIKSQIRKSTQFKEQVELNMKLRELEGEMKEYQVKK